MYPSKFDTCNNLKKWTGQTKDWESSGIPQIKKKKNLFRTFHWFKGSLVMGDSNIIIGYEWGLKGSMVQRQGLGKVQQIVKNCVGK